MKTGTYYILGDDGAERWTMTCVPVRITQEVIDNVAENVIRQVRSVAHMKSIGPWYGHVHLAVGLRNQVATVELNSIPLNIPVAQVDGIHVPAFFDRSLPYLNLIWTPPPDMMLRLAVSFLDGAVQTVYLVAVDPQREMWRLPLPNMYEDCKLCHNQRIAGETLMESLTDFLNTFAQSRWNSDLFQQNEQEKTESMFRWKADDEGFKQQPMRLPEGAIWRTLCNKVSVQYLRDWMVL